MFTFAFTAVIELPQSFYFFATFGDKGTVNRGNTPMLWEDMVSIKD